LYDDKVLLLHRNGTQAYATAATPQGYRPVFLHQGHSHPIPSEWLMPYYNRPRTAGTDDFYLNLLTRRTNGPLQRQDLGCTLYGMELEEGISKSRVGWSAFLLLLVCIAIAVGWAKYTEDPQTGLAIGACLMTIVLFVYTVFLSSDRKLRPVYSD
jgi:hypothetical protein